MPLSANNMSMFAVSSIHASTLQDELARVLYPLFIHCYLELISKRATSEAHQLLTKQKQRFISTGATTSKIRQQVYLLTTLHIYPKQVGYMQHDQATLHAQFWQLVKQHAT